MSFVEEQLKKFQKLMWSSDKPLLYAIDVVQNLLIENEKLRKLIADKETERQEFNDSVRQKLDFNNFENSEN